MELANNTVYGLAACVWSESINVALQVASQLKAGVVWVNCTNLFDASCGFGGYRESGYGREGGREGLLEYLEPTWFKIRSNAARREAAGRNPKINSDASTPAIDRTVKLYIGGKQAGPTPATAWKCAPRMAELLGEAPLGNRKDIRNAVEAAHKGLGMGERRPRTTAPRFSTTWRRIFHCAVKRLRHVWPRWSEKSRQAEEVSASSASFPMRRGRTSSTGRCTILHSATSRSP